MPIPQEVKDRFFKDPQWYLMEELILEFINPLKDMSTIDTTQPAEHVKAEVLGRMMSYDALINFVGNSGLVSKNKLSDNKVTFR